MITDVDKEIFLNNMAKIYIPNTHSTVIGKMTDDTIYWNINYDEIAPWKSVSKLNKSSGVFEIVFATENIKTESAIMKIYVKLNLSDALLKYNKILVSVESEIVSEGNKIEKFNLLYQIDKNNKLSMPPHDHRAYRKQISSLFNKYAVYPCIIDYMINWLYEFVNAVLHNIYLATGHKDSNDTYEHLYGKYKLKYLSLKNTKKN